MPRTAVVPAAGLGTRFLPATKTVPKELLPVVDTPGIRSFGLAHIQPDDVLLAFSDLAEAIEDCPRGCGHMGPPADPECALDALTGPAVDRVAAARRLLAVLNEPTY